MISDIKSISRDEEKGTIWNVRRGLVSPRIQSNSEKAFPRTDTNKVCGCVVLGNSKLFLHGADQKRSMKKGIGWGSRSQIFMKNYGRTIARCSR